MDTKITSGALGLAAMLAIGGGAAYLSLSNAPTYYLDGKVQMVPDGDGGYVGSVTGLLYTATAIDGGPLPAMDATPAPDAQPKDAGFPDAVVAVDVGPADTGVVVGLPGLMEPALSSAAGTVPGGKTVAVTPLTLPVAGGRVQEPDFKTTIRRTNAGLVSVYSQSQAFTYDNKYMLAVHPNGNFMVLNYATMAIVVQGPWGTPKLVPNAHKLIHIERVGTVETIYQIDLDTTVESVLVSLPQYTALGSNESYEDMSDDGRYVELYATKADGKKYFVIYDIIAKKANFELQRDAMFAAGTRCLPDPQWGPVDPDWAAPSPGSKYLVIQWKADGAAGCRGTELFDITTGAFVRQITQRHDHGDLGYDEAGKEVYVSFLPAYPTNGNYGGVVAHYLDGSADRPLRMLQWGTMDHVSCRHQKGLCVVSSGVPTPAGAFDKEIYLLKFDGAAYRIAHHRSAQADGYWSEPKPTFSWDGSKVLFSTDMGLGAANHEALVIELR